MVISIWNCSALPQRCVDDGKSTLIGRLLYDNKSIFQDQMEAIEKPQNKEVKNT